MTPIVSQKLITSVNKLIDVTFVVFSFYVKHETNSCSTSSLDIDLRPSKLFCKPLDN